MAISGAGAAPAARKRALAWDCAARRCV